MLATDAIHDLKVFVAGRDVRDEVEEVVGLAREPKRVETPQHEGAVADPGVSIVPVALAADRLRQRGRGGGKERSRRAVSEALQRKGAALQIALPRMLRKLPV